MKRFLNSIALNLFYRVRCIFPEIFFRVIFRKQNTDTRICESFLCSNFEWVFQELQYDCFQDESSILVILYVLKLTCASFRLIVRLKTFSLMYHLLTYFPVRRFLPFLETYLIFINTLGNLPMQHESHHKFFIKSILKYSSKDNK